jgi:CheY-like chemotaxis protein
MSLSSNLTNIPSNEHIMLLYNNENDRNNAAVNYINKGLKDGYHCIYASINAYDSESSSNISNLSSSIDNYKENIESGELRIINFKPYYQSALHGDLAPFKKLKTEMEKTLCHRQSEGKKGAILAFADAACFLAHNKYFAECERLEQWWHDTTNEWSQNNQNITVICPHPGRILNDPSLTNKKGRIHAKHTITIDLNNDTYLKIEDSENQNEIKRILIVEPEPDIQYLYSIFTKYNDLVKSDVEIVDNGNKCLEYMFSQKDKEFDIIILDTHIRDISGFEVARKIRDKLPNKKIILTTTYSLNNIRNIIDSIGIKSEEVVLKPFRFSKLFSIIESRKKYN